MAGQTIAELLIEIGVDVKGADKAASKIEKVTKSAGKTKSKGGLSIKKFAKFAKVGFGAVGAAAIAASAAILKLGKAVFSFVDETTKNLDRIGKESRKSGLGVEEFQRLGFAAERSGTDVNTLAKATRKLNVQMLDVAAGGGKIFTDALFDVGLGIEDIEGKTATEQLGILGDALLTVEDTATRAALAARLLGEEGGPQLLPLLEEGAEGINELSESATGIISEEAVKKAEGFQDTMTDFNGVISEIKAEIAVDLIPIVKDFIAQFRVWLAENQEFIKQDVPKMITKIGNAVLVILPAIADILSAITNLNDNIKDLDKELTNSFGPAWTAVKNVISGILLPIKLVGKAISFVAEQLDKFVRKTEFVLALARRAGITVFDNPEEAPEDALPETNVRGAARGQETNEEREARILGERQNARNVIDFAEFTRKQADRQVSAIRLRVKSIIMKGAKGRKFRKAEKGQLRGQGFSNDEIASLEKRNLKSKGKGGGKGGGGRAKEEEAPVRQLTSVEKFLAGEGIVAADLKLAPIRDEDIKPQAVINITNNNFDIDMDITGVSDPIQAGKEAGKAIKEEFNKRLAQAAQSGQVNVAR